AGRISAVSVMSGGPTWPASAAALREAAGTHPVDVGLHLNLTEALPGVAGEPLQRVILKAGLHLFDARALRRRIDQQLDLFEAGWGAAPDHVDGHQHVHQLAQVRSVLLDALEARYPDTALRPWLRASRAPASADLPLQRKAHVISWLGAAELQRGAARRGWQSNGHLLGVYGFDTDAAGYRALLRRWFAMAQDGDLLMCHPASHAPAADVIGTARQIEWSVWQSDALPDDLAQAEVQITALRSVLAERSSSGASGAVRSAESERRN
ncbi:ChbG/HpnK family deacetylase, partial [Sphaerotilus sp.]|uniref:ChbG/HpnK family deacetylase n=1 Tax=Sphaerotilus sp. TaxID=2093942 RepID=UPI0034E1A603